MPLSSQLSAVILAGGQSSRMGCDKALLTLRGQPLLRHVYEVAAACSDRVVVVTPWPERYRPSLPGDCGYVEEAVCDRPQGPLGGFLQGLGAVDTDWVMLLACDMPRLRPEVLQAWAEQIEALPDSTAALLPQRAGRWEPLCGFYRRSVQSSLSRFIDAGGRSFQQWLALEQVCPLQLRQGQGDMMYNCNRPEDWAKISWTGGAGR